LQNYIGYFRVEKYNASLQCYFQHSSFVGGYGYSEAGDPLSVVCRWPVQGGNQTPNKTQRNDSATDNANAFVRFYRRFITGGADLPFRNDSPIDEPIIRYVDVDRSADRTQWPAWICC
jgi:hypothetical protein